MQDPTTILKAHNG